MTRHLPAIIFAVVAVAIGVFAYNQYEKLEQQEAQQSKLVAAKSEAEGRAKAAQAELAKVKTELSGLRSANAKADAATASAKSELKAAQAQMSKVSAEVSKRDSTIAQLQGDLNKQKTALSRANAALTKLRAEVRSLKAKQIGPPPSPAAPQN